MPKLKYGSRKVIKYADLSSEVIDKLKAINSSVSEDLVKVILEFSDKVITDNLSSGNVITLNCGDIYIKSRKTNRVFTDKESTVILDGNINYTLKESIRDRIDNDSEYSNIIS